jgi:hypothetical protein
MASGGRPSKLTAELQEQFCELLRKGLFRKHAAARIGIPERTTANWYHRGAREERGKFYEFYLAVDDAEATFAQTGIEMLTAMQSGDPKVIQWLLSRRFPEHYGRKDNVEDERPEDRAAQQQAVRTLLMERLERLLPEAAQTPTLEAKQVEALPSGSPDASK